MWLDAQPLKEIVGHIVLQLPGRRRHHRGGVGGVGPAGAAGEAASEIIVEDHFSTPPMQHATIELTSCLCDFSDGVHLTVYSNPRKAPPVMWLV